MNKKFWIVLLFILLFTNPLWNSIHVAAQDSQEGSSEQEELANDLYNTWAEVDGKWYYYNKNGQKVTGMMSINGKWYYFNSSGEMQTGWVRFSNQWYYFYPGGSMVKPGWKQIDSHWYYFIGGVRQTGWKNINNKWYWLDENGIMACSGMIKTNGYLSYFDANGACLKSEDPELLKQITWWKIDGKWHYYDADGKEVVGDFADINGRRYYFDDQGVMVMGWNKIDGKWYYFEEDRERGYAWTGFRETYSSTDARITYYFHPDGVWEEKVGWKNINGGWYYFNPDHSLERGWKRISGKWYYFAQDGKSGYRMITGWRRIGGYDYYFDSEGAMVSDGTFDINGKNYTFDKDGHLLWQ